MPTSDRNPQAETVSKTWEWKNGSGMFSRYYVAQLTQDALYVYPKIRTEDGKNKILGALRNGTPAAEVFNGGTTIPLAEIQELKLGHEIAVLEIHRDSAKPYFISCQTSQAHSQIFYAIQEQVAHSVIPQKGLLSSRGPIHTNVANLFVTILFGGLFIHLSTIAVPDPQHTGFRAGWKNLFEKILAYMGTPAVTAIVLGIAAIFLLGGVRSYLKPQRATVLRIHELAKSI